MSKETTVTRFLALITVEWVTYGSEGVRLRDDIHTVAREHGTRAEIQIQADSAALMVFEHGSRDDACRRERAANHASEWFADLRGVEASSGESVAEGSSPNSSRYRAAKRPRWVKPRSMATSPIVSLP